MKPLYDIMTFGQAPQSFRLLLLSLDCQSHFLTSGTVWWFRVGWKCNIKVINRKAGHHPVSSTAIHISNISIGVWVFTGKALVSQIGGKGC